MLLYISKYKGWKKKNVSYSFYCNKFQFIWQKPYSTWRKLTSMNRNWTGKLQVTLLLLKKRFPQRCFSVNFTKFLRTSFDRTSRDNCFLSLFLNFSEHLFYKAPLRNCLFHVQVAVFQAADAVKNSFTGAIQAFYTRTRNSHSKAFIYLKFLKIIC